MNLEKAENILNENGLQIVKEDRVDKLFATRGLNDAPPKKAQDALETYAEYIVQKRYGAGQGRRMFDWNTRKEVIEQIRGMLADFEQKVLEIV